MLEVQTAIEEGEEENRKEMDIDLKEKVRGQGELRLDNLRTGKGHKKLTRRRNNRDTTYLLITCHRAPLFPPFGALQFGCTVSIEQSPSEPSA